MQLITSALVKFAFILKLAAALTKEELHKTLLEFEDLLKEQKNFSPTGESPLQFSPEGLKQIQHLGYSPRIAKDMMALIGLLVNAIQMAGRTGNEEMDYLFKVLSKNPRLWKNIKLNSMGFTQAKGKALEALDFISDSAKEPVQKTKKHLSPEELKEMQESGVI